MSKPLKDSYRLNEALELMKSPEWETIAVGEDFNEPIEMTEEESEEFITRFTEMSKEMEEKVNEIDKAFLDFTGVEDKKK